MVAFRRQWRFTHHSSPTTPEVTFHFHPTPHYPLRNWCHTPSLQLPQPFQHLFIPTIAPPALDISWHLPSSTNLDSTTPPQHSPLIAHPTTSPTTTAALSFTLVTLHHNSEQWEGEHPPLPGTKWHFLLGARFVKMQPQTLVLSGIPHDFRTWQEFWTVAVNFKSAPPTLGSKWHSHHHLRTWREDLKSDGANWSERHPVLLQSIVGSEYKTRAPALGKSSVEPNLPLADRFEMNSSHYNWGSLAANTRRAPRTSYVVGWT